MVQKSGKLTSWELGSYIPLFVRFFFTFPGGDVFQQQYLLVVSPHLKNISQIGSFPQVGVEIKIFETTR